MPETRVLPRGERGEVDGLDVLAVGLDELHPVRLRALAELVHRKRQMLLRRRRLGPAVVLEDEDRGHLPELAEVQRLVERAGVRRAVAEERDRDARLVPPLERERCTDDPGDPAGDDRVGPEVADLDVVEVHRAAVAVRAALDLPVELGHDPLDRRALRDRVAVGTMCRGDYIVALERGAHARGSRLLADRDVQEPRQLAGAESLLHLLLEAADQEHLAEEAAEHLFRHPRPPGPAFSSTVAIERPLCSSRFGWGSPAVGFVGDPSPRQLS